MDSEISATEEKIQEGQLQTEISLIIQLTKFQTDKNESIFKSIFLSFKILTMIANLFQVNVKQYKGLPLCTPIFFTYHHF